MKFARTCQRVKGRPDNMFVRIACKKQTNINYFFSYSQTCNRLSLWEWSLGLKSPTTSPLLPAFDPNQSLLSRPPGHLLSTSFNFPKVNPRRSPSTFNLLPKAIWKSTAAQDEEATSNASKLGRCNNHQLAGPGLTTMLVLHLQSSGECEELSCACAICPGMMLRSEIMIARVCDSDSSDDEDWLPVVVCTIPKLHLLAR